MTRRAGTEHRPKTTKDPAPVTPTPPERLLGHHRSPRHEHCSRVVGGIDDVHIRTKVALLGKTIPYRPHDALVAEGR